MNTKNIFISLILFCSMSFTFAQNFQQGNNLYSKINGKWYLVDSVGSIIFEVERVITVKFNNGISDQQKNNLYSATNVTVLRENSLRFIDLRIDSTDDVVQILQQYINSGLCKVAELNIIGKYFDIPTVPNDSLFLNQWYLNQIQAPLAWDISTGSPDVVVAILNSGVDWEHEDLGLGTDGYQNIWLNPGEDPWSNPNDPTTGDSIDNDLNGFIDDWKGWDFDIDDNDSRGVILHGTHVAGIVSAKTNNSVGIAGVAGGFGGSGAQLMIINVGNVGPLGSILDDAILYAARNGANIIQMSLGVIQTACIDSALKVAYENFGVFIDCASGNSSASFVTYPSNNPFVVAVGATDTNDAKVSFSNFGLDLEITAPGKDIFSTQLSNTYGSSQGTSFAAPQVAGVAALMLSVNPCLTPSAIRSILRITADEVGGYNYHWNPSKPGHSQELGYGRLNAFKAVNNTINLFLQNDTITDTLDFIAMDTVKVGQNVTGSLPVGPFVVAQGAKVTFQAGKEIVFEDGFVWEGEGEAFIIDPNLCVPQCRLAYLNNQWSLIDTIYINPINPTVNDTLQITIYGYFPSTAEHIYNINDTIYSNQVEITLSIVTGPGFTMIVPYDTTISISPLQESGVYNLHIEAIIDSIGPDGDSTFPIGMIDSMDIVISVLSTAIEETVNQEIKRDILSYNYPNPFSDHTHIDYYVKEKSEVKISVFNICGQKIITLVNNSKHPKGRFTATLDANNLTAGIYYYILSIGDTIVEKHKMIKIK